MSRSENYQRNTNDRDYDDNYSFAISSDLPIEQVYNRLRVQKKSEKEVEETVEKILETRERIKKVVRKFLAKLNASYGHLDIPSLMKKGMKHAKKYGLNELEEKVFMSHVMKGDLYSHHSYMGELKYNKMSKFLGFDFSQGQMINIAPKDHSKLNELHMLYDATKHIHADVKNQIFNYRDCAPQAIRGTYDKSRHVVSVHIHPVLAALFFPKNDYLERRMLMTNIARMVLMRGQAYLKDFNFAQQTSFAPGEIDAEYELAYDIAYDPNSMEHFQDDTPIDNMLKRFRCQVELYQAVLNLRQGKYYSRGYDENDGIAGFIRVINSYNWTFFDSPDMYHVQDEGTVLRKLLAVFSCRPTFTQLSSFTNRFGLGHTALTGLAKTVFVNIPVINIKLPMNLVEDKVHTVSLEKAMSQTDFFIEHKTVVPKNKSVIYSNHVAFFYANRRYPSVNFNALQMGVRCMSLPVSFVNTTTINKTIVQFNSRMPIGRDFFNLKSVVFLQRPPLTGVDVATGCAAAVAIDQNVYGTGSAYIHYNPGIASIEFLDKNIPPNGSRYVANTPVTYIEEYTNDPNTIGFRSEAQERGTIFFYIKEKHAGVLC